MKKVLIIEDDPSLIQTLVSALEAENFEARSVKDGEEGYLLATKESFDVIVLDLVLPTKGGLDICKDLRGKKITTPILMITGQKKEEIDTVLGLELGADDYLIKPFGVKEFLARVRALLRRAQPEDRDIREFSFGDVHIHFKNLTAKKGGKEISLTAREFQLLKLLVSREGQVVDRDTILNKVWGYDKFPTTRTVDTFVHNIRKKIEDDPSKSVHLLTIPWAGYKFQR
jgi:DNA-binding response OmpR family regulator